MTRSFRISGRYPEQLKTLRLVADYYDEEEVTQEFGVSCNCPHDHVVLLGRGNGGPVSRG